MFVFCCIHFLQSYPPHLFDSIQVNKFWLKHYISLDSLWHSFHDEITDFLTQPVPYCRFVHISYIYCVIKIPSSVVHRTLVYIRFVSRIKNAELLPPILKLHCLRNPLVLSFVFSAIQFQSLNYLIYRDIFTLRQHILNLHTGNSSRKR